VDLHVLSNMSNLARRLRISFILLVVVQSLSTFYEYNLDYAVYKPDFKLLKKFIKITRLKAAGITGFNTTYIFIRNL